MARHLKGHDFFRVLLVCYKGENPYGASAYDGLI